MFTCHPERAATVLAIAVATLSLSATAEDNADLPDVPFETIATHLADEGYTSIRMIDESPLLLSAQDPQHSEVRLVVNPKTGRVDGSEYVHWMDN